jgi:hypothetical protein
MEKGTMNVLDFGCPSGYLGFYVYSCKSLLLAVVPKFARCVTQVAWMHTLLGNEVLRIKTHLRMGFFMRPKNTLGLEIFLQLLSPTGYNRGQEIL